MKNSNVKIYDTTLRDGTQGEGISFSVTDKLLIAERLDQFGVDYIEGGFPGSNPRHITFFPEAKNLGRRYSWGRQQSFTLRHERRHAGRRFQGNRGAGREGIRRGKSRRALS